MSRTAKSVYRSKKVKLEWKLQEWNYSSEFVSSREGQISRNLLSPVLRDEIGSKWQFAMHFERRDERGSRSVRFKLFCRKEPDHDEGLESGAQGKIDAKACTGESITKGTCKTWLKIDRLICETEPVRLSSIPDELTLFANLNVSGWKGIMTTCSSLRPPEAPQSSLTSFLGQMEADSDFTDITIEAGGVQFTAHRVVLAARSPVLRKMLSVDMKERREAKIVVTDVSCHAWSIFQSFMYTDNFEAPGPSDMDLILEILMLSDKYEVNALKTHVEATLAANMTQDNVLEIFEAAQNFRLPWIKDAASDVIVRNWEVLKKEEKVMTWMTSGSKLGAALFEKLHF